MLRISVWLVLLVSIAVPAEAGWLSRLARGAGEVGEAGGMAAAKVGKLGIPAMEGAAAHLARLPQLEKGSAALAAHATPEGHWKFANREGEVFTAASAEELARVGSVLAPEAPAGGKLALYLSEETVFARGGLLQALPEGAELHLVPDAGRYATGGKSYLLRHSRDSGTATLMAEIQPNITLSLSDRRTFAEAAYRLSRPLNRANVRVLALEPGGPATLSSVPRFDPATKAALVDQVDPGALGAALGKLKGQTVLVTGRVEGDVLAFLPSAGGERQVLVQDLVAAAEASDVNLVVLQSTAPRQPGGLNWLWQTVEVKGLDEAMRRTTMGDFLSSLGADGRELAITASIASQGRVTLTALPTGSAGIPMTDAMHEWLGELTGRVVVEGIRIFARDKEREEELEARIVPGIPSVVQFTYLGGIILGLIGLAVARQWWGRIWPPEQRQDYSGAPGFHAARTVRLLAFVLLFMPIAGLPAMLWHAAGQLWSLVTAPIRALRWLRARRARMA